MLWGSSASLAGWLRDLGFGGMLRWLEVIFPVSQFKTKAKVSKVQPDLQGL